MSHNTFMQENLVKLNYNNNNNSEYYGYQPKNTKSPSSNRRYQNENTNYDNRNRQQKEMHYSYKNLNKNSTYQDIYHLIYNKPLFAFIILFILLFTTFTSVHYIFSGSNKYEFVVVQQDNADSETSKNNLNHDKHNINTYKDSNSIVFHKYEFILTKPINQWSRIPFNGSIEGIKMSAVIFYSVCCISKTQSIICKDDMYLESELYKNQENNEVFLNVKYKNEALENGSCFVSFIVDLD